MLLIGVTGSIGSGKSTVCRLLELPHISTDALTHQLIQSNSSKILHMFPDAADENQGVDRKKLAKIVFADTQKRRQLESFIHPRIYLRVVILLIVQFFYFTPAVVLEVPLLAENPWLAYFMNEIVLVKTQRNLQIRRVCSRDSSNEHDVSLRMQALCDDASRELLASFVIENDGDIQELKDKVGELKNLVWNRHSYNLQLVYPALILIALSALIVFRYK